MWWIDELFEHKDPPKGLRVLNPVLLILLLFMCYTDANGQQEPQYVNVFHYLDLKTNTLKKLERQSGSIKTKAKAFGIGGGSTYYQVKGGHSPVRIKGGKAMAFVVRGIPAQVDPTTMIKIVRFESKKGKRRWKFGNSGVFGLGAGASFDEGTFLFNVEPYGQRSLKITPAEPLAPGEYAISMGMGGQYFCFGVD